jgi:alpha-1,2-mannosyltransferase
MTTAREAPPRAATAGRVAVVAAVALAVGIGHHWYGNRHHYYDLRIYDEAIRWWAGGQPLYSFSHFDRIQGPLGFTYPPFAALLMYPMAWVSLGTVETVVLVANLAALAVTTVWLVVPLADRHGWPRWFVLGLALPLVTTLEPIRETITFGQINLLLAALVVGDLLRLVPKGSRWAGVGVGLATAIKLTPGIFIVYLLVTRRWRAAATATGTAAAATLLAAAVAPHDSWRYWTFSVWEANQVGHLDRIPNQAIWGTLLRLAAPHQPSRLVWLAVVALVAGYGLWRASRAARAGDELVGMTLAGLVGLLISPVSWQHHLYWFVPAIVVLVDGAATPGRYRVWYGGLAAVIWLTVTIGVIAFFDYGLSYDWLDTVPGFFISNWYLLLMLLLIPVLPIRSAVPEEMAASPGSVARSAA